MPNGRTHSLATAVAAGVASSVLILFADQPLPVVTAFAGGCLLGLIVNPDLDVRFSTHAHRVVRRTAGQVIAEAWKLIWWPYARLIPRHRHFLSHLPLLGTAIRLVYLWLVISILWFIASRFAPLPNLYPPLGQPLAWWLAGGLAFSDALHTVMDYTIK
jgi:uncharacterized metal-binding protein